MPLMVSLIIIEFDMFINSSVTELEEYDIYFIVAQCQITIHMEGPGSATIKLCSLSQAPTSLNRNHIITVINSRKISSLHSK